LLFEMKRRRRLGPEDHRRTAVDRLPRHREITLKDCRGAGGIPFLRLIDVPLHEADADLLPGTREIAPGDAEVSPRGNHGYQGQYAQQRCVSADTIGDRDV